MTEAEALALEAAAWLAPVKGHPLFGVCITVAAYAAADIVWRRAGRPALLNPVLVATALLGSLLVRLDISYERYLRQAEPINEMLALIVVLLAVPLCRQFGLIQTAGAPVGVALMAGSLAAIAAAMALPAMMMPETDLVATLAPKSTTTAVAVEIAARLGGAPGLTAVVVIATGVFGAAFGPAILAGGGIREERAVGFALGVASHAIGTARAFQISDRAGAFASLGMILNALLTMLLVPLALGLV
jgi:predicted murein hydrolase (TIGR00659 family)